MDTLETPPRAWGRLVKGANRWGRSGKHPHVRGEDPRAVPPASIAAETPPRAWGRLSSFNCESEPYRNTPTCVGKTRPKKSLSLKAEKHPHVRGEDTPCTNPQAKVQETPPRAWGRPFTLLRHAAAGRNTPTCVGKTHGRGCLPRRLEKHPHVRGEDRRRRHGLSLRAETPPRAWGRRTISISLNL